MKNLQREHDKCEKQLGDAKRTEIWKEQMEAMNRYIIYDQPEQRLRHHEGLKDIGKAHKMNKDVETQTQACENCCNPNEDRYSLALEWQMTALKNSLNGDIMECSEKSNSDERINGEVEENWKRKIEAKDQHITELEQKIASLENLLRKNVDLQRIHDLEKMIDKKSKRIAELEDAVEELEGFLKEDIKEMRDLRYRVSLDKEHIMKMEKWIQKNNFTNAGIDKARIIELEEMVTNLEDYVRKHDIDGLKRKLQDRECRIDQLENQLCKMKELPKLEENQTVNNKSKENALFVSGGTCNFEKKEKMKQAVHTTIEESNRIQGEESLRIELREKEQKIMEMGHDISEKDNKIQKYEQQIIEQQSKILKMEKEMADMEEELYETESTRALKEEIKLRNERVQELEIEVNSLETSFGERIDVAIEELITTLKEKEKIEHQLKKNLADKESKLEELDIALRQSISITDEIETKFKHEKKLRKEADQRITEMEEKIVIMQAASAKKCVTCMPLFYKTCRREVLKAALSEKDAILASLEHLTITTPIQADQVERLKMEKKLLLERLKEEDERSIKFQETTSQLFQEIFKTSDSNEDSDNNNNSFDHFNDTISSKLVVANGSPKSITTSCKHSKRTSMMFDLEERDQP